ncbi:hypothetical protein AAFF_G00163190 [Aldrovandia affinis]|uniref:Uncharacterized protein n=1 Tax=Aldrovandia affinis TaxID=143900 RepID=A0AAD7SZ80_9TELE|nr:hypothetical protein AAFF_G00163190 [Aldrovandia affinis]
MASSNTYKKPSPIRPQNRWQPTYPWGPRPDAICMPAAVSSSRPTGASSSILCYSPRVGERQCRLLLISILCTEQLGEEDHRSLSHLPQITRDPPDHT